MSAGAEVKEALEVAALVVSLGTLVFHFGVGHQRLKNLETRFAEFLAACKACKSGLDKEDKVLHGRITDHLVKENERRA